MRKEYDFSKAKKNPYARKLKKQVTIRLARLIHETGWILARGLRGVEKGVKNQEEPRSGSVRDVLALKNVAKGLPVLIFLVKRAEVSLGLPLHSKK